MKDRQNKQKCKTKARPGARQFFRATDLIFVLLILLLSGLIWYWQWSAQQEANTGTRVEIWRNNHLIFSVPRQELQVGEFTLEAAPHYIFQVTEDKRIKIIEAPCPDGFCLQTPYLEMGGEAAICVPGKLLLKITQEESQEDSGEADLVIGQAQLETEATQ